MNLVRQIYWIRKWRSCIGWVEIQRLRKCLLNDFQLAHALVEYETLNAEEVRKVIKGESIRDISDILDDSVLKADDVSVNTTSQPASV